MIKLLKSGRITAAVFVSLSLGGCASFDARMQANGGFDYTKYPSGENYQTGDFTNNEARNNYAIPPLTEHQKDIGFSSADVDIRPPTQLIPVIEGVLLEANATDKTTVLFNAFNQSEDIKLKVWSIIKSFMAENNIDAVATDISRYQIETGIFREQLSYGSFIFGNYILRESSYLITLNQENDGLRVAMNVDALSYSEKNDGTALKVNLKQRSKKSIELRFVNALLEHAYSLKEASELDTFATQPLPIKLGFDDNNKMTWVVDADFLSTWTKLPDLLDLLRFDMVDSDKNLGYFLAKFKAPDDEYWSENNLNPFELDNAEYFIQLGELSSGSTSITWLDADKNPLPDNKVSEIYFSITSKIRDVLLLNEAQNKSL